MKTDDSLPSRPQRIDAKNVEGDVARQGDGVAAVANQDASLAVERHFAVSTGQNRAKAFAPEQRGGLQRHRLQTGAAGTRHHRYRKRSDQRDDEHHRHHLDEREAGSASDIPASKCARNDMNRPVHCASSVMLSRALMIDTIRLPMTTLTTMIVTGPIAPIKRSRLKPSLCS